MSNRVLVEVNGISKRFCRSLRRSMWYGVKDVAAEIVGLPKDRNPGLRNGEFWAVKDVSFELRRGDCLGLIGPNGAGKSTMLKLLSGLIKPDGGSIALSGRVGALIELGAGFNPVLTGRENIFVNAAVLGISRKETEARLDEIVDFADVGDFLDTPVQSYSSGMQVRLGFAVAASLRPDILLIDEVLAVGDVGFRAKCYNAISRIAENAAVIFVSHNMPQISRLASSCIVMEHGSARWFDHTGLAISEYHRCFETVGSVVRAGDGVARIHSLRTSSEGIETKTFHYGQRFCAEFNIESSDDIESLVVNFGFSTVGDELVAECNNYISSFPIGTKAHHRTRVEMTIPNLTLNPGRYKVSALLMSPDMTRHFDWLRHIMVIEVLGARVASAPQQFQAEWNALVAPKRPEDDE